MVLKVFEKSLNFLPHNYDQPGSCWFFIVIKHLSGHQVTKLCKLVDIS